MYEIESQVPFWVELSRHRQQNQSLSNFARKCGVQPLMMYYWRKGYSQCSKKTAERIAKYLGLCKTDTALLLALAWDRAEFRRNHPTLKNAKGATCLK